MRDTISGGRRFIGCRELARWSIAFRNCNVWDLRILICEGIMAHGVGEWMEYSSIPRAYGNGRGHPLISRWTQTKQSQRGSSGQGRRVAGELRVLSQDKGGHRVQDPCRRKEE